MAKKKLTKTLYVGLGGTGISTILRTKKCFIDTYGVVPPMIGFLGIDTDSGANNKHLTSKNGDIIRFDNSELLVCTVKHAKDVYLTNKLKFDWFPEKNLSALSGISGHGAGQIRSNGRFIARYNQKDIGDRISTKIDIIHALIPLKSEFEVDLNKGGIEFPTIINVIGSIAGGTGSGILIDVLVILKETMEKKAFQHRIVPWIVLPEIFRAINNAPAMENVLYNTYGALRELDHLMHLELKDTPLDFGYTKINESPAPFAFLINNAATNGVVYSSLDDITDVLGRSIFIPSNEMGKELDSPMDNIMQQKLSTTYNIENKTAWAASIGSAELVYDNNLIATSKCDSIVSYICQSLCSGVDDGSNNANNFVDHSDVLIRENNGRDDVINYLIESTNPPYPITIDLHTTKDDVENYIKDCIGKTLLVNIQKNFISKLENTKKHFDKWVAKLLEEDGGVYLAKSFIVSLDYLVGLCNQEMVDEKEKLVNSVFPVDWTIELKSIRNSGIAALLNKLNPVIVDIISNKISNYIIDQREILRREWANKFYNEFLDIIRNKLVSIKSLEIKLVKISDERKQILLQNQQRATSSSKFQVFLHEGDLLAASKIQDTTLSNQFVHFMKKNSGVVNLLEYSEKLVQDKIMEFAITTSEVKDAAKTTIEEKLRQMPKELVEIFLNRVIMLASPLWTYNTQGFQSSKSVLDQIIVVGVENQSISYVKEGFKDLFERGSKANFASTYQTDKITVLILEDLLPAFAVNNFSSYKKDNNEKSQKSNYITNYLDEKWKVRMDRENFRVTPKIEQDDSLQYWVYGFIFDYIKYDSEKAEYWTSSVNHGKPTEKYRYKLGNFRDEAFSSFKLQEIHKEVKGKLDQVIAGKGKTPIVSKIKEIQENFSYYEDYSQMSDSERNQIEQPTHSSIKSLINSEIDFVQKLNV